MLSLNCSKKRTKQFDHSTVRQKNTNSFVHFLEESSVWKKHYDIVWPLAGKLLLWFHFFHWDLCPFIFYANFLLYTWYDQIYQIILRHYMNKKIPYWFLNKTLIFGGLCIGKCTHMQTTFCCWRVMQIPYLTRLK